MSIEQPSNLADLERELVSEATERIHDAFKRYPEYFGDTSKKAVQTFTSMISSEIHLVLTDERVKDHFEL